MMKTKLLVAVLAMASMFLMLAGMSIAHDQTSNANSSSGQGANSNRGGSSASRQGSNSADTKFAMTAAQDGMTEVELGRLAVQKGASDAVKQFGQRMIDDHTNANQQLMQLATSKGMTLPTALDAKHAAMVAKFQRLDGTAFDRAYSKQMVQDHRKAVDLFQKEADRGMDADLKAFASQTLPTLQGHLIMAQTMNGSMSASGGGNMNGRAAPSNTTVVTNNNGNMSGGNGNANRNGNSNRNRNTNRNGNANGNGNANK